MKRIKYVVQMVTGILWFLLIASAHAETPVWTFAQVPGFPPDISITSKQTKVIKYVVTNQSHTPHSLVMQAIVGIHPSGCTAELGYNQSCLLTLTVKGQELTQNVVTGPALCQVGNAKQCYQPSQANQLQIIYSLAPTIFPAAQGPNNVIATPGNAQVTVKWTAPTNTGTGTITGYNVTYGFTNGTNFTTTGCTTSGTSCTITGLTNGTSYTFAVTTNTVLNNYQETGPASLSSPVTPTASLAVSPATLALSGLGNATARTMSIINNSSNSITINSISTPSPALPSGASVDQTPLTDCSHFPSLAAGNSCTITVNPGTSATSSSGCTAGTVPTPSVITITANGGALVTNANVLILSYGCQYQGGYVFSIDDSKPSNGSIGGKVASIADQAAAYPNGIAWSPAGVYDSIWSMDDSSTTAVPSPNASSNEPATLTLGQLNCDAVNDGFCTANNAFIFYGSPTTYAQGLCQQPLNNSGAVCSGGSNCYTDWYLPSVCELGPFGSTGINTGSYPRFSNQLCSLQSTNIQNQLINTNIVTNLTGYYWSSTEYSEDPLASAWVQSFDAFGGSQSFPGKENPPGVRCVRGLTF